MAKGAGSRVGEQRRQKWSTTEILKPGFQMPDTYEDLVKVYKTVAKSADQRLVRLEQASKEDNFKVVLKWSYARAQHDIKRWSGEDVSRFNTKPPASKNDLQAKIEDIKTFLKSPTSTKKDIKEMYKKKADTINKQYGTNFKWDQVGKFFESKLAKKMDEEMSSKTMLKVIATIQKDKKAVIQKIEAQDKIDIKAPDKMIQALVDETIAKYGKEIKEALFEDE